MKERLEYVQTQWSNYERKLNDKREMLTTYAKKIKEVEDEHLGCIEKQMKDRKEIDALTRVVTVETQKHMEKDSLARKLEHEKVKLQQNIHDLQREL